MHATEFVESYFDAWNHRDAKAVADHLAVDGLYCDIPQNVEQSHDELIVSLGDFFSTHRNQYELIGDILQSVNTIAFQYRICPPGTAQYGKSEGALSGAEFMTMHGDEAITITDYYDIPGATRPAHFARMMPRRGTGQKYAKSGLSRQQLRKYKACLEQIMQTQHAYLQPELTLPKLAMTIGCSVNHLSQVINSGFGMSFFDYLNRYRIDHAKGLLSGFNGHGNAVLNIAFTVGFNSNSAFYSAFKKRIGMTPAQYRRAAA